MIPLAKNRLKESDVCLLVEGAYPYVSGGVSSWLQSLIESHPELRFHLVALVPRRTQSEPKYKAPRNLASISHVYLFENEKGTLPNRDYRSFVECIEQPLMDLQRGGGYQDVLDLTQVAGEVRERFGRQAFFESRAAWQLLERMYHAMLPSGPFTNYVWSWRSLVGALLGTLMSELPEAKVYHAISTGYAGLLAARARVETGRPVFVTEHGIYNNERRIEITQAEWLNAGDVETIDHGRPVMSLRDIWLNSFSAYTRACYTAASRIITLYEGNQLFQLRDGADPDKLQIVPNGVAVDRFAGLFNQRGSHPPTMVFIGRVVPIKDVKTFVKAAAIVKQSLPEARIWLLGPTEEDSTYFSETQALAVRLVGAGGMEFKGKVNLADIFSEVDVVVLTSLSEAQPLVILEAGAAGVPVVATDVGACREMILGANSGVDEFGEGGAITALSSPEDTAREVLALLKDPVWREKCGVALQRRVRARYNKPDIDRQYKSIYTEYVDAPTQHAISKRTRTWRV